ncbi:MAG: cation-translocating P-type ATPase [Planctomycetes bacterium]|nr:cation-translocating P-type ATPase [Planctomycetota bacterium]
MSGVARQAWHALSEAAVLQRVGSDAIGLTSPEHARRLLADGPNTLRPKRRPSALESLARQLVSPLVLLLLAAGIVAAVLREWLDAGTIAVIVVLNALIGFSQERHAERAIAELGRLSAPRARVRRDGGVRAVDAEELVVGDVVELEAGDVVPADLRLLGTASLRCAEAALTGESESVGKRSAPPAALEAPLAERRTLAFAGTHVVAGTGHGVVIATGMDTEVGAIAGLLEAAASGHATPLQQRLAAFGRLLVIAASAIVALLFVLGLARGVPASEMLLVALGLAVAAVPEGLPAVVTIALAVGVMRMARRRAIVRHLPAVETLGAASVICTDKTGTLTRGEMSVRAFAVGGVEHVVVGEGYGPTLAITARGPSGSEAMFVTAALAREFATVLVGCCDARLVPDEGSMRLLGDPTEGALLALGLALGVTRETLDREAPRVAEWPFDSDRKRMSVARAFAGGRRLLCKGAPEAVLPRCTHVRDAGGLRELDPAGREALLALAERFAAKGLRVLAAASRAVDREEPLDDADHTERGLCCDGLVGMQDAPRAGARDAVARCQVAGIRVVMITGDHPRTAGAIAEELGILRAGERVLTGPELATTDDDQLARLCPTVSVYARTSAEHKLRIVRAWQGRDAVVAMTGDGVNDAPALEGADIGIAMGSGTEVTKSAADMVIADDDFATIVAAAEEGRGIWINIQKTLLYLLAGNCGEILFMTTCIVAGLPMPLLPVHLLWINLVTDGLPALGLATDPIDSTAMRCPPRARDARLIDRAFVVSVVASSVATTTVALAAFLLALRHADLATARTHAFTTLVFAELLRAFVARGTTDGAWWRSFTSNPRLTAVVLASVALQFAIHQVGWLQTILRTSSVSLAAGATLAGFAILAVVVVQAATRSVRLTPGRE